jgi:tRNA G46 methylase TrmB
MSSLDGAKWPGKVDIIIELGSGNGQTLLSIATRNIEHDLYFIGIESNSSLYKQSCSLLTQNNDNITFVNDDFEYVISTLEDESISMFISILPHPNYIGKEREVRWKRFYQLMLNKLKVYGQFLLITECTNELLSEVTIEEYEEWRKWLISTFEAIGFSINIVADHPPPSFLSYYLSQFSSDTDRIKIITLLMGKQSNGLFL